MDSVIELSSGKMWLDEDGIVCIEMLPNAEVTLADAQEAADARFKLAGGRRRPLFVDIRKTKSVTREARAQYARESAQRSVSALALYVDSKISTIMGNFFISYNKPPYPARLFVSKEEAIKWLKGFIE